MRTRVVCCLVLALVGLALVAGTASATNHPMHGAEKAPAVNAAVYYALGFYPSKYVIQHCVSAYEGTANWSRWAVVVTTSTAHFNPLCHSVTQPEIFVFVQVQNGYWEGVYNWTGTPQLCHVLRLPWGMLDNLGTTCPSTPTTTTPAAPLPVFIAGSYWGRRPVAIYISADGGNIITHLQWSNWGYRSASANGTSNIQNCVPNCASGTDTPVPTSITLEDPSSGGYFTKLVEHRNGTTAVFYYTPTPGHYWPLGAS
jgi:hypothetical protein